MPRGKASGISLSKSDARIVLGMENRGDRNHDIAAWFGVNQGRIAEVKSGDFGTMEMAAANELPPKGPPGVKGRRLRNGVERALETLASGDGNTVTKTVDILKAAIAKYDSNEA